MRPLSAVPLLALTLAAAAFPALGETTLSFGGTFELYHDPNGAGSADELDVTVYGEAEVNSLYIGASALKSNDKTLDELALGLGHRGEVSGVAYDIGLARYLYPQDSASNYSELALTLSKEFNPQISAELGLAYDLSNQAANAALGAAYAATDALELSANFSVTEVPGAANEREWDLGATYALTEDIAADLRWYDGSAYVDGYVGVVFSWDTSILK